MKQLLNELKPRGWRPESYFTIGVIPVRIPPTDAAEIRMNIRDDFPYIPISLLQSIVMPDSFEISKYAHIHSNDVSSIMRGVRVLRPYFMAAPSSNLWYRLLFDKDNFSSKERFMEKMAMVCNSPVPSYLSSIYMTGRQHYTSLTVYRYERTSYNQLLLFSNAVSRHIRNFEEYQQHILLHMGQYIGGLRMFSPVMDDSFGVKALINEPSMLKYNYLYSNPLLFIGIDKKDIPKYRRNMLIGRISREYLPQLKFFVDKSILERPSKYISVKRIYEKKIIPASQKFNIPIEVMDLEKEMLNTQLYGYNKETCATLLKNHGNKLLRLYSYDI